MEPLIIGLIILAISSFFNKDKKEKVPGPKQPDQIPQQRAQRNESPSRPQTRQGTRKRIEDYARDMYRDLQAELQQDAPKTRQEAVETAKQVASKVPRSREETVRAARKATERAPRPTREQVREQISDVIGQDGAIYGEDLKRDEVKDVISAQRDLFPLDATDVQRGIILAEVLGSPKSKRK